MEIVQIYPRGNIENADKFILSVLFEKSELLSMGVKEGQIEISNLYIDKDEFTKLYDLWMDPEFLNNFFDEHREFFSDDYWDDITKATFISDVISSVPSIFHQIRTLFDTDKLENIFKPLGKTDEDRQEYTSIRVKSKFGSINHRTAFRIYAIRIEDGCYIITGGTIKITKNMQDAPNTAIELNKLNAAYKECGIADDRSSFIEFILE